MLKCECFFHSLPDTDRQTGLKKKKKKAREKNTIYSLQQQEIKERK